MNPFIKHSLSVKLSSAGQARYPPICVISAAQQGRLQEAQNWAI
jgi:hypothetical protein